MERLQLQERLPTHESEILELITHAQETGAKVYVSGRPLIHYPYGGEPRFYSDCEEVFDMPSDIVSVTSFKIDPTTNDHLDSCYQGEYAAFAVRDPETGDEYILGIRPKELGFSLRL